MLPEFDRLVPEDVEFSSYFTPENVIILKAM